MEPWKGKVRHVKHLSEATDPQQSAAASERSAMNLITQLLSPEDISRQAGFTLLPTVAPAVKSLHHLRKHNISQQHDNEPREIRPRQ
jgi:hypothetical protein